MPKFIDTKILDYVESPTFRNQSFEDWVENIHDYQASGDTMERAIERAYWSSIRADQPRKTETERALKMDTDLMEVLAKMEFRGVYADPAVLTTVGEELRAKAALLLAEMHDLVNEPFNPLSAKQVQYILYTKLGIPVGKKIKTWFSVDSETLDEISKNYAIAGMILEYRGYEKLRGTYTEGLVREIRPSTGRIHTNYNQTVASTGRLSSESPNLQNIPAGDGYAKRIKSAFRPEKSDWIFVVADYSQVELRVLAMLSGDMELLSAFKNGEDIHARTAKFLFPNSTNISSDQRRIAKSVNFGVIYGITGFGLSKMIKSSPKEATEYINTFFARYPGVRAYYDALLAKARETGYVETYYGRRRTIKGLNDANSMVRAGAEREAMNMPVQGTAADVMKLAMIELDQQLEAGLPGQLLMQVHDELVLEVPREHETELTEKLRTILEWVLQLDGIDLKVDIHSGDNWATAKG